MQLLEATVRAHGDNAVRSSAGAVQLAKAVGALVGVPFETTSDALAAGARLIEISLRALDEHNLPLSDIELRAVASSLDHTIRTASSRWHPSTATSARLRRRSRRRGLQTTLGEASSGDADRVEDGQDAAANLAAELLPGVGNPTASGYAAYQPIARQLLKSAHALALKATRAGVPPYVYPNWSPLPLQTRRLTASPASIGMHALWNVSCDPVFRRTTYGILDDKLNLVVPSSEASIFNNEAEGGGSLIFRVADVCDQGEMDGGAAAPIEGIAAPIVGARGALPSGSGIDEAGEARIGRNDGGRGLQAQDLQQLIPDSRWATADVALLSIDADPLGAASQDWRVETRVLAFATRRSDMLDDTSLSPVLYDATFSLPIKPFDDGRRTDHLAEDADKHPSVFAPEALFAAETGMSKLYAMSLN